MPATVPLSQANPNTRHLHTIPLPGGIPDTHREHSEATTTILVPKDAGAFLNPVQGFNRDLSVAVIRAWNELRKEELEGRWRAKGNTRKRKEQKKTKQERDTGEAVAENGDAQPEEPVAGPSNESKFRAPKITILEALSATGLRSIRYAKEIPDVKTVLANDLSPSACEAMRMNVAYNGVGETPASSEPPNPADDENDQNVEQEADEKAEVNPEECTLSGYDGPARELGRRPGCKGKVRVTEGDACTLMYQHREPRKRVEVVDLDPYGTAAPFIDAALGCIADGGLLCVTCTDLAVLAGSQYPEKAFSNYGGSSVNAEYCHEVGLRLVLNTLSTTAARYGRYITPLLCLSIDFYVRLYVRVKSGPHQVKSAASNTGIAYVCGYCQTPALQPFGRMFDKPTASNPERSTQTFKSAPGTAKGESCEHCGSTTHVGGPMWLGPIQESAFANRVLDSIDGQQGEYKTWTRMHGMLTVAQEELPDPFYFTCNRICGFFHTTSISALQAVCALLNGGYKISRSHAGPGTIKTDAPRSFIFDMVREHVKSNPVRMDKIAERSPTRGMLAKEQVHEVDFTPHAGASKFAKGDKVVYYQANPLPNWGPGSRAKSLKTTSAISVAKEAGKREVAGEMDEGQGG